MGFDHIVSIGANCGCAMLLNEAGLRLASSPFDWLMEASFQTRIATLCRRFADLLVLENIVWFEEGRIDRASDVYRDCQTGYRFVHDFPKGVPMAESFPSVKAKYDRRIARLLKILDEGQRVCLVWRNMEEAPSDEACRTAVASLRQAYPRAAFQLLVLENDPSAAAAEASYRTLADGWCVKVLGNFMPKGSDVLLGDRRMQCRVLRRIPRSAALKYRCRVFAFKRGLVHFLSVWHLTREGRKAARKRWSRRLCLKNGAAHVGW